MKLFYRAYDDTLVQDQTVI